MIRSLPRLLSTRLVFGCAVAVALVFALYTNHVWEDYYITYRSSKNLATGHGLVFNHGEKLHTFTSPLGVLLPAAACLLTGNTSDTGALWIFRFACAAALGGAAAILGRLLRQRAFSSLAALAVLAGLLTDAKTIDFTINGMETAFMLLFLAYAFWAHLTDTPRRWLHLGAAWAGLMWTRPDSFIYVALIAAGVWLFPDQNRNGGRAEQLRLFLRAGLVTTALYLPWLLWAWAYYGTPIPHTITAKGGIGEAHTLLGLLGTAVQLPYLAWTKGSSLELTFLPSYYMIGGWPPLLIHVSRALATVCCLLWLLPFLRPWPRAASLAYFGAHVYLTYFPYFPFPWYIPSTTVLALIALAGLVDWLGSGPAWRRTAAAAIVLLLLGTNAWSFWQVARQVRAQQIIVEDGTRRRIGEWLHDHAATGDTVFMEPLGYIGFFSGLKTYDWPGMSSREMVHAREEVGASWGAILRYLHPKWVVLRPFEVDRVNREAPGLLPGNYELAHEFDQSAAAARLSVHGRPYLEHDAHFLVLHQRLISLEDSAWLTLKLDHGSTPTEKPKFTEYAYHATFNGHEVSVTGTPSRFGFPIGPDLSELTGGLGMLDESWTGQHKSGPVEFSITLVRPDGEEITLLHREINPVLRPDDRGFRFFRLSLPQPSEGLLRFDTAANRVGSTQTRAFWGELAAIPLRTKLDFDGAAVPATAASHGQFGFANTEEAGEACTFAHAASTLVYDWQPGMNRLQAGFGIMRKAYTAPKSTEGVIFMVETEDAAGGHHELFRRHLDPFQREGDRGDQQLDVLIPPTPGGRILLHTLPPPSGHLNNAWSYWRYLRVHR